MGLQSSAKRCIALLGIWQCLIDPALAKTLATVTPCPECGSSIAPAPITITAQYQTVSTCKPSTTTVVFPYTKRYTTGTTSKIETTPSCSPYAWVSTTIPVYDNSTKTSTVVTSTAQPVTFNSVHYTEAHTTTITLPAPYYGSNGTHQNATHPKTTTEVSYTTIDVKKYCKYNSLGPIAIPYYEGSGLCTDCGPDSKSALTQRLTVISCSNKHCTTFNETWVSSPKTYSASGKPHTMTTTNTYCPTATPETAMPGYTHPAGSPTSYGQPQQTHSDGTPPNYGQPPQTYTGHPSGSYPPTTTAPTHAPGYPPSPTYTNGEPETEPTDGYGDGHPEPTDGYGDGQPEPTDGYGGGEPDPTVDPSGGMGYDRPTPTEYQPGPTHYKVFKRQGLEQPRGRVMRRGGMLFWGS
ncbi:hypothetical protein Slin15195_G081480 [Septoria linicola]|uniref:Uncharacterized protein n=1 Tax=Septoria linicola TaxID=215465 RepID=A0A9Q9ASX4_9PEZI|nr:hypothetical protein Slin15195_G081480 [Septoria linicola]